MHAALIAVAIAGDAVAAGASDAPDARITELVSLDEAAARALAFIDAVEAYGSDAAALPVASPCGWQLDGKDWYWYGNPAVSETEDVAFGFYDDSARAADQAAFDAPLDLLSVPAGTDRGETHDGGHYVQSGGGWVWSNEPRDADGGALGYDSIGPLGSAKNVLTIGDANGSAHPAAKPAGAAKSGLSGWGPADDGRIKPDVVANGAALFAPGGSGSQGQGGLLRQHYSATHGGADMLSATLKGLVIHTADEADTDGPDYRTGWGLLSVSAAQQHITLDGTDQDAIQELHLGDGGVIEQDWVADGATPIKATICWTDPAGTPPALALDPETPMLVNDLDLRIIGPGNVAFEPWVLDPADPDAPATRGDNDRDNVEVVLIAAPAPGVYRLRITHKGVLAGGGQDVALILSRVNTGPVCEPGEILDCNGNPAPAAWLADGVCDDGARMYNGNLIDFSCVEVDDGDDCVVAQDPTPPFVVWRNTATSQHALWFTDGVTVLPESGGLPAMPNVDWHVAGTGDFDGDGRDDLFWRNTATGQNRIWFMSGTSLVPDEQPTTAATTAWSVAAVTDFDADGKADVLWRNAATGGNAVWFMDGTSLRPETGTLPGAAPAWQVAGTGDFDADGFPDILWRHAYNGQNVVWFMDGTTLAIDSQVSVAVSISWQVRGVADFDGDGKADILWRNVDDNRNAVWFMDGVTLRPETGTLPPVPATWDVAAVADLDADGHPEIFWRNTASGQDFIWFLSGTSLVPEGAYTASAGPVWSVVGVGN